MGPYRTVAVLGSGAMGRVLLGRKADGGFVAIKLVHPSLADDEGFRARFRREVKASRKVSGANTAAVLADDTEAHTPWMASEYVAGLTLAEAVEVCGPFTTVSSLLLASGLVSALTDIHRAGLVHRDLKPSNIMLTHEGVKVIDFGIARAVDASTLTGTGTLVGSYAFMSPEQILADSAGPASDVFALGAVLGFAANGYGPFDATTVPAITHRIVTGEPRLGDLTGSVRELVEACLAKDPQRRSSLPELSSTLDMYLDLPLPQRPWHPSVHECIDALAAEAEDFAARTPTSDTFVDPDAVHVSERLARVDTEVTSPADSTKVDSRAESGGDEPGDPRQPDADGVNAAKYVRELARQLGVNLGLLTGTGPGGEITSQNVRDAATAAAADRAKAKARQDAARKRERARQRAAKAAKEKLKREQQNERPHEARAVRGSSTTTDGAKSTTDSAGPKNATGPGPKRPATPTAAAKAKAKKKNDAENAWAILGVVVLVVIGIILVNQDEDDGGSDSPSNGTGSSIDYAGDDSTTDGYQYDDETTQEYVPPTTESVDETAGCSEAFDAISTYVDSANSALDSGNNSGAAGSFASLASELRGAQDLAENSLVETNLEILAGDTDKMASALYGNDNASYDYWREVWTGDRDDLSDSCYG